MRASSRTVPLCRCGFSVGKITPTYVPCPRCVGPTNATLASSFLQYTRALMPNPLPAASSCFAFALLRADAVRENDRSLRIDDAGVRFTPDAGVPRTDPRTDPRTPLPRAVAVAFAGVCSPPAPAAVGPVDGVPRLPLTVARRDRAGLVVADAPWVDDATDSSLCIVHSQTDAGPSEYVPSKVTFGLTHKHPQQTHPNTQATSHKLTHASSPPLSFFGSPSEPHNTHAMPQVHTWLNVYSEGLAARPWSDRRLPPVRNVGAVNGAAPW